MNNTNTDKRASASQNCEQCGTQMNPVEAVMGAICGKCCRENHKAVIERRYAIQPGTGGCKVKFNSIL